MVLKKIVLNSYKTGETGYFYPNMQRDFRGHRGTYFCLG